VAERNDGRGLEAAIGRFFASHGYAVSLNAVREGRSGGRHEIDVLAEKSDALTTFLVGVECKSWSQPIEKDVVSKLHYVIGDLALHKGIVVSTAGCRIGADQAARELGIELWGPDELRHFLGAAAVAELELPPGTAQEAVGWSFRASEEVARKAARAAARGSAVLRRQEEVVGLHRAWVPAHLAMLTVAQPNLKWRGEKLTTRRLSNLYDALAGGFITAIDGPAEPIDLRTGTAVPPLVKPAKVAPPILKAYERLVAVSSAAAIERHSAVLASFGVPLPCRGVSVESVELVYFPVWIALLRLRDAERLVAVSGRTGHVAETLSAALTSKIAHLRPLLASRRVLPAGADPLL